MIYHLCLRKFPCRYVSGDRIGTFPRSKCNLHRSDFNKENNQARLKKGKLDAPSFSTSCAVAFLLKMV